MAPTRNEAPQQLLLQAEVDIQEGRTALAYQLLEDIIARYPDSKQAGRAKDLLLEQFRALRRSGDEKESFEKAAPGANAGAADGQADGTPPIRGQAYVLRGAGDFKTSIGDRVFFDAASALLDARQMALLRAQARWLIAHPDAQVRIEARADDPGSDQMNADLARDRAELVRGTLATAGVAKDRIVLVAIGNRQPIAKCGGRERSTVASPCAAQNRVVVTVVEWAPERLPARRLVTGAVDPGARRESEPRSLPAAGVGGNPGRSVVPR